MQLTLSRQTDNKVEYNFSIVDFDEGLLSRVKPCILIMKRGEWIGIAKTVSP